MTSRSMGLAVVLVFASLNAGATVEQRLNIILDDAAGNRLDDDTDSITGAGSADIDHPIFASISGTGYDSWGAVGISGQLGVQGNLSGGARRLVNQVIISSDEHVNLTGQAQQAVANFIIDGGDASMYAGAGSEFTLQLDLQARIFQGASLIRTEHWQGGFTLTSVPDANFGQRNEFHQYGEDINAQFNGTDVDIPFSLQTFDIGAIPVNGRIDLEYFLHIEADIVSFAEWTTWSFSDPLEVEMGAGSVLAPDVVFASPVPLPPAVWLLGSALVLLGRGSRLRRAQTCSRH